jgi:hypothetical protein
VPNKLVLKKLTASDLTFFEWQFRNRNAGNQKAINLNADVLVDRLFPALPELVAAAGGKIPLDLSLFGPGLAGEHNLQRKIVKFGAYKNWRLNGEFIFNPDDGPNRYNILEPGDLALIEFVGGIQPTAANLLLISGGTTDDAPLFAALNAALGATSMRAISQAEVRDAIAAARPSLEHPVHLLVVDAALEDAALGGGKGTQALLARRRQRSVTSEELERARRAAEEMGRLGEALLDSHFRTMEARGLLDTFTWASAINAVAPYDFQVVHATEGASDVDAKSTAGEFERLLHISASELTYMAASEERYDLYRLYEVTPIAAKLRVARDVRPFARSILACFRGLPAGVTVDGVSVDPTVLEFGSEELIELPPEEGDESIGS